MSHLHDPGCPVTIHFQCLSIPMVSQEEENKNKRRKSFSKGKEWLFWQAWKIVMKKLIRKHSNVNHVHVRHFSMPNVQGVFLNISFLALITDWSTLSTDLIRKVIIFAVSTSACMFCSFPLLFFFFFWAPAMCHAEGVWVDLVVIAQASSLPSWRLQPSGGFIDTIVLIGWMGWKLASFLISSNSLGSVRTGQNYSISLL